MSGRIVLTCDVLTDEVRALAKGIPGVLHIEVLKQGLHNDPPLLRTELQSTVDRLERDFPDADAIVLGYGLCSRGTEEVAASRCRIVVPRGHDCITILLGSKDRYAEYVARHPGTYWYSPGWNRCHTPPGKERHDKLREHYLTKFEPDDVDYLMETEQAWFQQYTRATFVDLGVTETAADEKYTQDAADWLKWSYDRVQGDPQLLIDLMAGNWDDERFLVLEPGQQLRMVADERVFTAITRNGKRVEGLGEPVQRVEGVESPVRATADTVHGNPTP